jgi:hypothetical protein
VRDSVTVTPSLVSKLRESVCAYSSASRSPSSYLNVWITSHSTGWPVGSTGPMGETVKTLVKSPAKMVRGQGPAVGDDLLADEPHVAEGGAQRGEVSGEPAEAQVAAGPAEEVILRVVVPRLSVILTGDRLVADGDQAAG